MDPAAEPIRMANPILGEREQRLVNECVETGWISSQGKYVGIFERRFADFIGAGHGVAVCNGTAALSLALLALKLQHGDEVIVPSLTFGATASAVVTNGGIPNFVRSEERYWQMDAEDVAEQINDKTRGIIVVHLYGHPTDLDPILELADEHGLWVIEDAAEAHGAEYRGRRVGALGHIGCFSFYANKIITTGEGGMCLTNDTRLADQLRKARDHGMSSERRYWHDQLGSNFRMSNLQAALGVGQMDRINDFIDAKRRNAGLFSRYLEPLRKHGVILQDEASWARSVYWMYNVILPEGVKRDKVMKAMAEHNVETRPFFYPLHTMPIFKDFPSSKKVDEVTSWSLRGMTLPSGADVEESDIAYVASTLQSAIKRSGV